MVSGNWLNYDGLYLQFGTTKAIPEMGGDYLMYGSQRELEVMISLGQTVFGLPTGNVAIPALPSSFQGTIASQTLTANTGIVSYTTLFPLQPTAPVAMAATGPYIASSGAANGILNIINPQMFIEQIDLVTLVPANAGTGAATGLTGIGLVAALPPPLTGTQIPSWAQITPDAGLQLMGVTTIAQLQPTATMPAKWMFWPGVADSATQFAVAEAVTNATATSVNSVTVPPSYPSAGRWLGNVPLITLAETMLPGSLPNNAYISAIASGGTFTGAAGGGLLKLRVRYYWYGSINDATSI
jgi:hypothetical protein